MKERIKRFLVSLSLRVINWVEKDTENSLKENSKRWANADDDMQNHVRRDVIDLLNVFSVQGHSGSSAPYVSNIFSKLAAFEPLGPLTGEDHEWSEYAENKFQNKRCSHVFKENGKAYDIKGKIFRSPDGYCYTNRDSSVPVVFPYYPKSEYIDVPE